MTYGIRYRPGTPLAALFGTCVGDDYDTRESAEAMLRCCANANDMEVVETLVCHAESAVSSGTIGGSKTAPGGAANTVAPGASPITKGSTSA